MMGKREVVEERRSSRDVKVDSKKFRAVLWGGGSCGSSDWFDFLGLAFGCCTPVETHVHTLILRPTPTPTPTASTYIYSTYLFRDSGILNATTPVRNACTSDLARYEGESFQGSL